MTTSGSTLGRSEASALAFGYFIGGINVALACLQAGVRVPIVALAAVVMYSATGELAMLAVLVAGGSAIAAFTSAVLVSSRFGVMGISLAVRLRHTSVVERAGAAFLSVDPTIAVAIREPDDATARRTYWRQSLFMVGAWLLGSAVGVALGSRIHDLRVVGLDVALPASLLGIAAVAMRDARARLAGFGAALICLTLVPYLPAGLPILAAIGAAVVVTLASANIASTIGRRAPPIISALLICTIMVHGATVRFGLLKGSSAQRTGRFGVVLVLVAAAAIYSVRLMGMFVLAGRTIAPRTNVLLRLIPVSVVMAVVTTQTLTTGDRYVIDARLVGVGVAAVALRMRQSQAVVLLAAASTAAFVRLFA